MRQFTRLDCDRYEHVKTFLSSYNLPHTVIPAGGGRFFHSKADAIATPKKRSLPKVFVAHYDRVPASPGANDNSAAVAELLFFLRSLHKKEKHPAIEILLTDQEEAAGHSSPKAQGSFLFADAFKQRALHDSAFFHFDMCGRGETVIVSEAAERLLERRGKTRTSLYKKIKALRTIMLQKLSPLFRGRILTLPTPFSDNLGFLLQGLTVLQVTLLPHREAFEYQKNYKKLIADLGQARQRSAGYDLQVKKTFEAIQPETWKLRHSARDTVETLDPESFNVMQNLLECLVKCDIPLL